MFGEVKLRYSRLGRDCQACRLENRISSGIRPKDLAESGIQNVRFTDKEVYSDRRGWVNNDWHFDVP